MSSAISRCNVQHLMRVLLLVFVCLGSGATSQPWKSFAETDIGSEKRNGREETSGIAVSRNSLEGRRSRAKSEFSEKQRANEESWISTWAVISNTSMTIQKAVLQQTRGKSLIDIQSSSALKLWSCRVEIAQEGAESPFRMESGESVLFNISLQLPLGSGRMANLVSLSESKHILSKPGRVSVSSSDFRDLVQCHGSFLPSSPSTSVAVRQCEFINMTQMHEPFRLVESGTAGAPDKNCIMDSINCRQVQNPFMGCVVDGASCPLFCFNSSFMECSAESERHTFDTEEKLFEDTTFSYQSSSEISGGAIFLSGNATLTLKNCLFESCRLTGSSSRAAAVRNKGTGAWTSENTTFHLCSSCDASGAFDSRGTNSLIMNKCKFIECDSHGLGAGELYNHDKCVMSECDFFNNQAITHFSGALNIYRMTNDFSLLSCQFRSNRANTFGGAICFDHSQENMVIAMIQHCLFINNSAGTQGNDIHVNGSWNGKLTLTMSECYSLSEQPRTVFEWANPDETKEYLKDPLSTLSVIVVAVNGFDWDGCGKSEQDSFNCLTVKQGVKRAAEESMEMRIKEGEFVSGEVEVRGGNVTGRGEGKEATVIRAELGEAESALVVISGGEAKLMDMKIVDDGLRERNRVGCLFLVSDGESSLELSGCILAGKDSQGLEPFSKTRLCAIGGGITLQMCDVSGFGMGDASFVEAGSTFESVNTTYSSVTRAVGHGTVVGSRVGEGRSVVFENCTVEGCSCGSAEGRGGGVLAEIAGRGSFQIKSSEVKGCLVEETGGRGGGVFIGVDESSTNNFSVGNVTVGGNQARWGRDVFVLCGDLNVSVSSERVFEIENAEGLGVDLAGTDSGLFSENPVDLGYFLEQRYSEVIEISEDGVDVVGCGDGVYPCESFWRGYENVKRGGERKGLKIRDKARICDWYDLSGFTVEGVKEEGRSEITLSREMTIGEGIKSIVWNNGEAGFSRMEFRMPPSLSVPVKCAIESSGSEGGMLTLADCSFGCVGGGGLTYALVVVGGGMMEMEECMITDMRFERQPFEFCGSSEIRLLEDEFVNAELKGHALFGLEAEEGGDENGRGNSAGTVVKMNGTQFRGVVLEDTNEACIVSSRVGLNVVVVADGCLFEGVRSELSSEGGAIGMVLGEGGMLEVVGVETKAKGCACEAVERGKGGFVCVELQGEGSGVLFEEMEFEGNDAWVGRDMFVKCADLTEVVNETSFGFAKEIGEDERKNSLVGVDGVHFGDGEDLFVFITGYYGEVVYVDGKEGVNNIGCGKEIFRCSTFEYGVERVRGEGMRRIVVGEMCWTERETTLKMVGVESEREDKMSVMEVEEVVEKEKGMVFAAEGASFLRVNFSLPGRLANGQRALIGVCGEGAWVEVRECVFSGKKDCVVGFHLVAGEDGDVGIVKCEVCDVVTESALFVFEESGKEGNGRRMELEGCRVRNVRNRKDEASVVSSSVSEGVFVGIGNSTIELCSGGSKSCGGGVCVAVAVDGRFEMNDTVVEGCEAVEGKGGGVYLRSTVEEREALGFVLGNVEFGKNKALVGRDVYVRCWEIESQISERQFVLDLREPRYDRENAIWGGEGEKEEDLIPLIVVYRSELIFVCGADGEGSDSKPCGNSTLPCRSLDYGLSHVLASSYSQVLIDREAGLRKDCQICSVTVKSLHGSEGAKVVFREEVEQEPLAEGVVECSEGVWLENMGMVFRGGFRSAHECVVLQLNGSCTISRGVFSSEGEGIEVEHTLVKVVSGRFEMRESRVEGICGRKALMRFEESSVVGVVGFEARELDVGESVMWIGTGAKVTVKEMECWDVVCGGCSVVSVGDGDDGEDDEGRGRGVKEGGSVKVAHSSVRNIRRSTEGACAVEARLEDVEMVVANCSFGNNTTPGRKGQIMSVEGSGELVVEGSLFEGKGGKDKESLGNAQGDEMCRWNGSLVELVGSKGVVRDTTVRDGAEGGMGVVGGSVVVEKGVFEGNRPLAGMEKYPSYRRNILCSGMGEVDVVSVKGGDGMGARSSMWMLNEGCNVKGITEDRGSSFFIPTLREVRVEESSEAENVSEARVRFVGSLLIPCNLSFRVVVVVEDVEQIECFEFEEAGHVSEDEAVGKIPLSVVSGASAQTEVKVCILFGNAESPSSTESFIVKNKSEPKVDGEDRIVEGGKEGKFTWVLIVCVVIVAILLIALIISIIRWRKQKRRAEELEVIVEDTVKKDPKLIEMVTMEMSPEEQWRRGEKEVEKKNEERIKKRMNGKEMVHSESEEYLLSESGSTEYILGKDSDKIPDWALEKVDEEEIRKRTPSPSISSTSTTSTTDSDSTFVRGEDLCPTTSSMSNLVDAMACSSPHEKLIVDLRDSLFMLLHGRNEKKEMAIGSLQQREQTAAQILFWVANLALHSFDEMENGLSSLANLSPHIVLFSEHMVICIALHSDCSSDSDTSSSISSTTVVTSASDDDDDSLPSSAFEDCEDNRKECLRWKAPELLINKNMGTTKESVAFSIGMMLWECLTLEIPFGEYEAEVAGQKIVNGERPRKDVKSTGSLSTVVGQCLSAVPEQRPTLAGLKREFIQRFPAGGLVMTVSDAVDVEEDTNGTNNGSGNGSWSLMSER